jgi:hypothetical protein
MECHIIMVYFPRSLKRESEAHDITILVVCPQITFDPVGRFL